MDSDTRGETFACLNPAFPCINGDMSGNVPDDSIVDLMTDSMTNSDKIEHDAVAGPDVTDIAGFDTTGIVRLDATNIVGLDHANFIPGTTLDGRSRKHRENIIAGLVVGRIVQLVTGLVTIAITIANTITTAIGKNKGTDQYRKTCPRVSAMARRISTMSRRVYAMARGSRRQTEYSVRTSDGFHNYSPGFAYSMNPGIIEDQGRIIRRISRDASMDISF